MLVRDLSRLLVATIVALAIVALLAWARNDAGVDDRDGDPEDVSAAVAVADGSHAGV